MTLSHVLKSYRAHNKISMRKLADHIGLALPTYARIEKGRKMEGATLRKILFWLLEGSTNGGA